MAVAWRTAYDNAGRERLSARRGAGTELRAVASHRAQHEQHGGCRALHYYSAHHRLNGWPTVHAWLAARNHPGPLRRDGVERVGGGHAWQRRYVLIPSAGLREIQTRPPAAVPVHLAVRVQWAAGDRLRLYRLCTICELF